MKPENVLPPDDADPALPALLAALQQARTCADAPRPETLARWLDGTATPAEAASVERALCDDPELRRAVLALATRGLEPAAGDPAESVPADELQRIEALVVPAETAARSSHPAAVGQVLPFPRTRWLELVACAAAIALVAWPAWKLGQRFALDRERAEQRELARLLGANPLGGGAR